MHIVNGIATQNNISIVTSFVHTTSKKHTYRFFYIKCYRMHPTKHDVKDIIKTFEDYLQVLQTKTSRHQNVNDLEIIY